MKTPMPEPDRPPPLPSLPPKPITPVPKPAEPFKPTEEPIFHEKPTFLPQPKPISHSPKISPSSIPNPSPSVTTTKQVEPGYPSYGGYLYSIPGYSAFQPVSYPGVVQPNQAPLVQNEPPTNEFVPFPTIAPKEAPTDEKNCAEIKTVPEPPRNPTPVEPPKPQTDFEDHFTPEIVPPPSMSESSNQSSECKMSITSLTQGSGATVTIPSQATCKDTKAKPPERFSLKTSIPISKIDMKCVNTPPDAVYQNSMTKKTPVSQPTMSFQSQKPENGPRVEIQSNIVIKTAQEPEIKETKPCPPNNSISTLLNAAEVINKNDSQFRKPDPKPIDITNDAKDPPTPFTPPPANSLSRPIFNPINVDSNKVNYPNKPPDSPFNEQKNQILFIQNKSPSNPKMLLTIQQQNPQVLLQRSNFESKNLQAPSRLSSQSKKCKEELVNENGSSSKVVALKRLHQENCDENDFENLITENQIYGNKIVVKEKSQGTQQEQDLKNKVKVDKPIQNETKNVVLQPNFVYLSNVQFPANLMMIKNNPKVSQGTDTNNIKPNKISPNENKNTDVSPPTNTNIDNSQPKTAKPQNIAVSKEIHVLKSSNNVLQTLSNKTSKPDIVFQTTNQKVIMSPQIVYQVPMLVETDNKTTQPFINREFPKFVASNQNKKEFAKPFEPAKPNDKLYIACPYQMDSKLQPKIVITNIRPKVPKIDEVSSLDIYEKRRRLRRLKYLSNRETKEQKTDAKKVQEKVEHCDNIITPEKMKSEVYKEFSNTKVDSDDGNCESDSDYGEEELNEYNAIIKKYAEKKDEDDGKAEFLSVFRLASKESYKEKQMERQERMLQRDSVASAYIAAGRIDRLVYEETDPEFVRPDPPPTVTQEDIKENGVDLQKKQTFLSQLKLVQVSAQYKQGYERVWHEILKERKRRLCTSSITDSFKKPRRIGLDPNGQLQILTEIKKCVNENNNLIKRRLDCSSTEQEGDSIKVLAEKNFSELNRLSKMADRSVKIFSGQETRKMDLNPGFDSENIQKHQIKIESKNFTNITIPSISKIISLKSTQEKSVVASSQATSMDEPPSSAAGVKEMSEGVDGKAQDFSCQVEEVMPWPGIETIMKSYKEYEIARKKEIAELHRRNTALRVECAHVTHNASRDSDRARALLAERQHLAAEENSLRLSVQKLCAAIEVIRNS